MDIRQVLNEVFSVSSKFDLKRVDSGDRIFYNFMVDETPYQILYRKIPSKRVRLLIVSFGQVVGGEFLTAPNKIRQNKVPPIQVFNAVIETFIKELDRNTVITFQPATDALARIYQAMFKRIAKRHPSAHLAISYDDDYSISATPETMKKLLLPIDLDDVKVFNGRFQAVKFKESEVGI